MIVVGAHYLPFVTLYGMKVYAGLAAALVTAGISLALYVPNNFGLGGWVTGFLLISFAFLARIITLHESKALKLEAKSFHQP